MKLWEIQSGDLSSDLDKKLQDVGAGINQNNNSPDTEPTNPQDDLGDDKNLQDPNSEPEEKPKNIDSYIVAAVKGMPYVTEYTWDTDSKISPIKLIQMDPEDLKQARLLCRQKIAAQTFSDQFGTYDDPSMKFYQNAMNFIEKIITLKQKKK